ncbi:MAG: translesion error-prone DNA polymerase V autoproteolytic subunit [Verrucomicrobia bacterium]|nr:translesion error-prone DNA polymerase V autoproteolytic subunit [Verrucomicrobiota bacterium]MBS0637782.1 translesion error-prone DNA polymerase V autoproteolytic subunit [Verrucomicrobiota bacterium]
MDEVPLVTGAVQAGFSSVADEHIEAYLDLNDLVIKHPAATFFVRAAGDSMEQAGIFAGDILAVDRSLSPVSGKIVIACLDGEFMVKRLFIEGKTIKLISANPRYLDMKIDPEKSDFHIWGVVTYVIHAC